MGDRVGIDLVFDRRVGGPRVRRFEQTRARCSDRTCPHVDHLFSSRIRRDSPRAWVSYGQLSRGRKATSTTDTRGHGVDHLCLWFQSRRPLVALAILAGPILGTVSAIRAPGLPEPSRPGDLRQRLEERPLSRVLVCPRSSSKPSTLFTYVCSGCDLGRDLPATAKPLRARTFTCAHVDNRCGVSASSMDSQPPCRV